LCRLCRFCMLGSASAQVAFPSILLQCNLIFLAHSHGFSAGHGSHGSSSASSSSHSTVTHASTGACASYPPIPPSNPPLHHLASGSCSRLGPLQSLCWWCCWFRFWFWFWFRFWFCYGYGCCYCCWCCCYDCSHRDRISDRGSPFAPSSPPSSLPVYSLNHEGDETFLTRIHRTRTLVHSPPSLVQSTGTMCLGPSPRTHMIHPTPAPAYTAVLR
jgi:hypothetical protein